MDAGLTSLRNMDLNIWYQQIKERLSTANDKDVFGMVCNLEDEQTIRYLTDSDGVKIRSNEGISKIIPKQIASDFPEETCDIRVNIDCSPEDVQTSLDTLPRNNAAGIDDVGYLLLWLWLQLDRLHMTREINRLICDGFDGWTDVIKVLILKAGKWTYDVAKSWRMIYLLPIFISKKSVCS